MVEKLFQYRFELFFFSLITILFGEVIFPGPIFDNIIIHILFLINISSGLFIFKKKKKKYILIWLIFVPALAIFVHPLIVKSQVMILLYIKFFIYFAFYSLITYEIIIQVWNAKTVNRTVIYGLMSGYIALGLIGFFVFNCIELVSPNSFRGLTESGLTAVNINDLMYYSYVSLITIGFGDILPVTDIAKKATLFIALAGQFYMVIITAVVIEKYIRHSHNKE